MKRRSFIKASSLSLAGARTFRHFPREQKGYQGYLPLETLGEGDPERKVKALYSAVSQLND